MNILLLPARNGRRPMHVGNTTANKWYIYIYIYIFWHAVSPPLDNLSRRHTSGTSVIYTRSLWRCGVYSERDIHAILSPFTSAWAHNHTVQSLMKHQCGVCLYQVRFALCNDPRFSMLVLTMHDMTRLNPCGRVSCSSHYAWYVARASTILTKQSTITFHQQLSTPHM